MSEADPGPLVIRGWTVFAHALFLGQVEELTAQVEALQKKDPTGYKKMNAYKRLLAIKKLAFDTIPTDPTREEYRQGDTLGAGYKHWFRGKFLQQYRLFFRYHLQTKVLVLAWVNDEDTKRAYGGGDDAYLVFRKMLDAGNPPDGWRELLEGASAEVERLQKVAQVLKSAAGDPSA